MEDLSSVISLKMRDRHICRGRSVRLAGQRLGNGSGGHKLGFAATAPSFPYFDAVFSLPEIAIDFGSNFCIALQVGRSARAGVHLQTTMKPWNPLNPTILVAAVTSPN